jgi:anti-anti-sigma factor
MEYRIDQSQGVTVLRIAGEIDVSQALELREALGGLVRDATSRVVVDLAEVPFVDSSGIGILVTAHRRAVEQGGGFAVAAATPPVGQVFAMTRTERLLHLYPSTAEATAALSDHPGGDRGDDCRSPG